MNNIITSKEDILKASRELIKRKGINSINMRSVAEEANIAVGSIYNYFKSKEELTIAVIVSVWADIFHSSDISLESESFIDSIDSIFKILEKGDKKYPNFFALHSNIMFGKNKDKGVNVMMNMIKHIKDNMYKTIIKDKNIREDAFNDNLNTDKFIDIIFSFIMDSMMKGNYDSSSIKEIIKRTIY
ncbi:TetR family transcriptional regulator [Brachyspira hampsonii 30446]|uniref:TetR family transcriptional regulator n=1 Tax=Brachyspira hampsonii 30446 TaxID=1289135 RepID=A0A2U4FCM5_9SPIR|nr:TetR/AcrR family transcriptional regulator [Brachyspira hampsonii]EKV57214.1 TetR family transcriptional regulator [Brachyspira hampsonii 30446]MBW5396082.1 TetR/AcrR family transcriptional regulator [Brachyspira hampsonii]OEJ19879.1 TetR family transcriptional regulator [Brachyspira hampsonii]